MAEVLNQQAETTTEASAPAQDSPASLLGSVEQQANPTSTPEPQAQEQAKEAPTETAPVVPEQYEFQFAEGEQVDPSVVDAYSAVAKDLKLSQEDAQKMLGTMVPAFRDSLAKQQAQATQQWAESSKADKEFGGDSLNANLAVAKQALDSFATPELRALLEKTGLGNHPEVIRMFYRAGKSISQDRLVTGTRNVAPQSDPAKILYPNMA